MADYMVEIADTVSIVGEGTRTGFVNQIVCESLHHAIELSVEAATNRTGGAASRHGMVELTHSIDKATPALRLAAAKGTNLGTVKISRMSGQTATVLEEIELANAFVGRVDLDTPLDQTNMEPGDNLKETFALLYTKIKWTEKSTNVMGGWDTVTQAKV